MRRSVPDVEQLSAGATARPLELRARARPSVTRIRGVSTHAITSLDSGWQLTATGSEAPDISRARWSDAVVPGTAAAAFRATGDWDWSQPRDFDADDWWYRCEFSIDGDPASSEYVLTFGGLATVADVWLNDTQILSARSMFTAFDVSVSDLLRPNNVVVIRFLALAASLGAGATLPRARWRTALVREQRLRGLRTTLLGRMPGWSPPAAPVGPWRPIALERRSGLVVESADVRARVDGDNGIVSAGLIARAVGHAPFASATLVVSDGVSETRADLSLRDAGDGAIGIDGAVHVAQPALWWPHTHGAQPLYHVAIDVHASDGTEVRIDLGRVGFRTIERAEPSSGRFELRVNGVPVFCRGACWTPADVVTLGGTVAQNREAVRLACDGGMNMLRVAGNLVYESDDFYDACDELGILVWQDWMFANMDYPVSDAAFMASVETESRQLLARLQGRPSLAVLCGGSEVAQQAAMLGLSADRWQSSLFDETLPAFAAEICPGVPYVPSSPWGGTHPFQPNAEITHYYGVGAYLRPLSDARTSEVRFATECLAFANVPDASAVDAVPGGAAGAGHDPRWKARVPRDVGASWDFEDVRDHYLREFFRVDPLVLRRTDPRRYLALSRVVTGELIERVIGEWRRPSSTCRGGLVWFYRDLWPGAGWGLLDSFGRPKAAYYYARRAMRPVALIASDEGLNGLYLHAINDTPAPIEAKITLRLYRDGAPRNSEQTVGVVLPAHGAIELHADALLAGFADLTYAYRFGPPQQDLIVATMRSSHDEQLLAEAFHFPLGLPVLERRDATVSASATQSGDGAFTLTISASAFAQSISIDTDGYRAEDAYFHLAPGAERTIVLRPTQGARPLVGSVHPLNASSATSIVVAS